MLRLLLFSALALTLLFTAGSCTRKSITASGSKHSGYTKFNFRINNNQQNRSSIYKRYVAHNRNFKEFSAPRKNMSRTTEQKNKGFLAQNKN